MLEMKLSLRFKIPVLLLVMISVLSSTLILVTRSFVNEIVDGEFRQRASDLTRTVAVTIDSEKAERLSNELMRIASKSGPVVFSTEWGSDAFNAYVAKFSSVMEQKEYKELLKDLRSVQDVSEVDCIYLTCVDPVQEAFFYLVDAAHEDPCVPGVADPIYEMNRRVLTDPSAGFPAYITDTEEYGWLVTAGTPVFNQDGKPVCYVMTDISMAEVRAKQESFLKNIIGLILLFSLIVAVISISLVERMIIHPLDKLIKASKDYQRETAQESYVFSNAGIHTGDEIEELADSMAQMEQNLNNQISNLTNVTNELYVTQNLAVRDALTGIRNTLGYSREAARLEEQIQSGTADFGLAMIDLNFLKKMNDSYGHEKGDIALKKTASLICNVFLHSPVFRIGGDEFLVVLENNDLEKADQLVSEFEQNIQEQSEDTSLPPWERVSTSIGYAVYDPEKDRTVEDVFHRADEKMYQRKVEMKAVRND